MMKMKTENEITEINKQNQFVTKTENRQRHNGKQTKQTMKGKIKYVQGWT